MMKTVVALLFVLGTASALECFVCNSHEDEACSDEFQTNSTALQNAFIETCPEEEGVEYFCRKMRMDIEVVYQNNEIRIKRDCGKQRREGYECYQKRSDDYIIDVCQCDTDLCNNSPSLSMAPLLALTLPFFARFL